MRRRLSRCATSPYWFRSRLAESRPRERSVQGWSLDRLRGYASDARSNLIPRHLWAFSWVACNPLNLAIVGLTLSPGWGLCNRPFLRFVSAFVGSYAEFG